MKISKILLLVLVLTCSVKPQKEVINYLTNNKAKLWYLDNNSENEWVTLWYFNLNGDYYKYYYNLNTDELEINDSGDNIEEKKFNIINKDTISLNKVKFPIVKITNNEFILKNIYPDAFFLKDFIHLKNCSIVNKLHSGNCEKVLKRINDLSATNSNNHNNVKRN